MSEPSVQAARELVTQAVGCASVSGHEGALAHLLVDWMQAHGFQAEIDLSGSAVGVLGHGPLTVVLLGHIDTVPGEIAVRVEDEVLHGRGSVDAKGSVCTFLAAVAGLPTETLAQARFVCIGATEEEAPSSRGARHAVTQHRPDYVLIGEPSGWQGLTLGYKGRLIAHARVEKDNFHSAGEGESAADSLTEYWFRVRGWARELGGTGLSETVQASVQRLSSSADGLTQRAEATIGLRLPPRLGPEEAETALAGLSERLPVAVTFTGHERAVRHERDNALTRALRIAIRAAGGTPVFKFKSGTSDMNVVAPHWPVPTLAYGPGDSSLDHTPHEQLDLREYDQAVAVLRAALVSLAAAPTKPAGSHSPSSS